MEINTFNTVHDSNKNNIGQKGYILRIKTDKNHNDYQNGFRKYNLKEKSRVISIEIRVTVMFKEGRKGTASERRNQGYLQWDKWGLLAMFYCLSTVELKWVFILQ